MTEETVPSRGPVIASYNVHVVVRQPLAGQELFRGETIPAYELTNDMMSELLRTSVEMATGFPTTATVERTDE